MPRGDTAGANLVLESVSIQAGDRDLLEVWVVLRTTVATCLCLSYACLHVFKTL